MEPAGQLLEKQHFVCVKASGEISAIMVKGQISISIEFDSYNMNYMISFYDKGDQPIKISEQEFKKISPLLNSVKFINIHGSIKATGTIKSIDAVKEQKLSLPPPSPPPITHERLIEFKNALLKKFNWN